jgi:hypothetical protein
MNGTATVLVLQGGQILLAKQVGGPLGYVAVTASASFCYLNFDSNGQAVQVSVSATKGQPLAAYNVYNNYISNYTAALITYPPQFAVNMGPAVTPTNNGLSFLLVAPEYSQPTPLAIWVGEGFSDPVTGNYWWAQIGFNNWAGSDDVSYAGWGIFSNIFGSPGGTDYNYPLLPGRTYNFTMAQVSGTNWEFAVNGTLIQEGSLTGLFNTTTTVANEGTDLGLETLTAVGGNVNVTNMIKIPVMASFRVGGKWTEASSFTFGSIGENWYNNVAGGAPGIGLWGIAGHLQNPSVPDGSLLFNDSLPMVLDVPSTNYEPLYGGFGLSQTASGGGIVDVSKVSSNIILVSPVSRPAYVSVASYEPSNENVTSLNDALITAPKSFNLPTGSNLALVYASNSFFNETSVSAVKVGTFYDLNFTETGLPPGTIWSVGLNGTTEYSPTTTVTFPVSAGRYEFVVPPIYGWMESPASGLITVTASSNEKLEFQSNYVSQNISASLGNVAWVGSLSYYQNGVMVVGDGYGFFNLATHVYTPIYNRPFVGYSDSSATDGQSLVVGGSAYTPPGGARLGVYTGQTFRDASSSLPTAWTGGNYGIITSITYVGSSFLLLGSTTNATYAGLFYAQNDTYRALPKLSVSLAVPKGQDAIFVSAFASSSDSVMVAENLAGRTSLGVFFLGNDSFVPLVLPSNLAAVGYAYGGLSDFHGIASDGQTFLVTGGTTVGTGWEALYSSGKGLQDVSSLFKGAMFDSASWNGSDYQLAGRLEVGSSSAGALYIYNPSRGVSYYGAGLIPSDWSVTQLLPIGGSNFAFVGFRSSIGTGAKFMELDILAATQTTTSTTTSSSSTSSTSSISSSSSTSTSTSSSSSTSEVKTSSTTSTEASSQSQTSTSTSAQSTQAQTSSSAETQSATQLSTSSSAPMQTTVTVTSTVTTTEQSGTLQLEIDLLAVVAVGTVAGLLLIRRKR